MRKVVMPTSPTSVAPVVRVDSLRVAFRTRHGVIRALRGVSLSVQPGEVLAIVGESGSGKSVLAQTVLGLRPPSVRIEIEGSVQICDVDMLCGDPRRHRMVRRHLLGAVFQDPLTSLNPTMPIGKQLQERGVPHERAIRHLREAGVPNPEQRFHQYPHELSGGLRQRAMIAMALGGTGRISGSASGVAVHTVSDEDLAPRLIVADEPTTALDVSVQAQILLLFDRLRRDLGCALLLVTHDLGVAASIADRIAVVYAGRLCEIGPAADLLANPSHPYTRALLRARPPKESGSIPAAIPGEPPDPLDLPPGCAFAPRCPRATAECDLLLPDMGARPPGHPGEVACVHPIVDELVARARPAVSAGLPQYEPSKPEPGSTLSLELAHVWKSYEVPGPGPWRRKSKLVAVADVSLRVPQAGSLALVGESGCGKTTALRIATGLLRPNTGDVNWTPADNRPQMVFQDAASSLTPWMTIGELVEERLMLRGVPTSERRSLAVELLARVGLDRRVAASRPRELSGGQKQRAVIARALASEPKVLACDEPVSALDASLAVRILGLLESLRSDLGVALLVVTHDLAAAHYIADGVLVMYLGRIVEQAATEILFSSPSHPYTQGLIAAIPTTEPGRLAPTLAGEPPDPLEEHTGCPFAPRCPIVEPRCNAEVPTLRNLGQGTTVACHLA
jgi:peptide/nickel transport system ATP-binding protein